MTVTVEQEWWLAAACRNHDQPEIFFPTTGETPDRALRICRGCPVRRTCLEAALLRETDSTAHGIWGGTSATERKQIRRCRAGTCRHIARALCKGVE